MVTVIFDGTSIGEFSTNYCLPLQIKKGNGKYILKKKTGIMPVFLSYVLFCKFFYFLVTFKISI